MTEKKTTSTTSLEQNLPLIHGNHKSISSKEAASNTSKSDVRKMSEKKSPKKAKPDILVTDKGMKKHMHSNGTPAIKVDNVEEDVKENVKTSVEKRNKIKHRRASDVIDSIGVSSADSRRRSVSLSEGVNSMFSSPSTDSLRGSMDVPPSPSTPSTPISDTGYSSSLYSTPQSPSAMSPELPSRLFKPRRLQDTVDAAVMNQNQSIQEPLDEPMSLPVPEAHMPVDKDADMYNMNHLRRGHAIIFNNDKFDTMEARTGSEVDVDNLQKLYTALGFQITVHQNKDYQEIKDIINKLAEADHSDEDCLVVTLLTHGMGKGYVFSRDVPYNVDLLWTPFTADNCITLAGKPKIFIIQACRGEKLDPGVNLNRRKSRTETDSSGGAYKIPSHADFLIAYSSVEGFYSWRNPESGTWFIECLCAELMEKGATMDFLKILTRTSRRVALDRESYNDASPLHHRQKQVPSINSMLIRDIYFHPKEQIKH